MHVPIPASVVCRGTWLWVLLLRPWVQARWCLKQTPTPPSLKTVLHHLAVPLPGSQHWKSEACARQVRRVCDLASVIAAVDAARLRSIEMDKKRHCYLLNFFFLNNHNLMIFISLFNRRCPGYEPVCETITWDSVLKTQITFLQEMVGITWRVRLRYVVAFCSGATEKAGIENASFRPEHQPERRHQQQKEKVSCWANRAGHFSVRYHRLRVASICLFCAFFQRSSRLAAQREEAFENTQHLFLCSILHAVFADKPLIFCGAPMVSPLRFVQNL
eukprot:284818951_6